MPDQPGVDRRREGAGPLVRRANLGALLRLVHHGGPQSRAQLTQRMGLNRSTVAALVAELTELGLLQETDAEPGAVGRPSPVVSVTSSRVVLTVNPDVDAVTIGLVGLGGTVLKRNRYPAVGRPTAELVTDLVVAVLGGLQPELDEHHRLLGISVAVPGLVDRTSGTVVYAPHLGWQDEPLAAMITAHTGYPCRVANDAQVGLLGERHFGAGRGLEDVVYLNGSASGIGGAALVGGRPLLGVRGFGGELGHTVVNPDGGQCHCGRRGCLETEVTRAALLAALGLGDDQADRLSELVPPVSADAEVAAEVERQVGWLGQALTDIVHVFNPRAVLLGGFLGALLRWSPTPFAIAVTGRGFASLTPGVRVEPARLGPNLLLVGSAELMIEPILLDPALSNPADGRQAAGGNAPI